MNNCNRIQIIEEGNSLNKENIDFLEFKKMFLEFFKTEEDNTFPKIEEFVKSFGLNFSNYKNLKINFYLDSFRQIGNMEIPPSNISDMRFVPIEIETIKNYIIQF